MKYLIFMFSKEDLSQIKNLINTKKNIVIVTHYNPDGDAIGSSLATLIIKYKELL